MIGVLSFQGSFQPHLAALARLGVPHRPVRSAADLAGCSHLILPGGESTVISQLLQQTGLGAVIQQRARAGDLALFGTCAGAILLGRQPALGPGEAAPGGRQPVRLDLAPVAVRRNAYGRQIDSFRGAVTGLGPLAGELEGVFIRAPRLEPLSADVEVLARDGETPVLVRHERCLLSAFHPELTEDLRIHRHFAGI